MVDPNEFYRKMPFYRAYPMQSLHLDETEYEKDMERMKAFYPAETKEILSLVEQRLDQLEFEGSRIYDEEPDRLMMQMEIDGILRQLAGKPQEPQALQLAECFGSIPAAVTGQAYTQCCGGAGEDPWLRSMVSVLFGAQLCRRRCRYRRCRRWL